MISPDAVVTYQFLGLNYSAIAAVVRVAVTLLIILLTIRIPFKRNYHWMFLVVGLVTLLYVFAGVITQLPPAGPTGSLAWLNFVPHNDLQALVVFQFVVYFVSRKASLWEKLVLIGGYAFVVVTVWFPLVFDPGFLYHLPVVETTFGWQTHPGTGATYLRPYGIDIFITVMTVLTFFLLLRHFRSEKSPLMRGQTKYLVIGILLVAAGAYALTVAKYTGEPNIQNFVAGAGDFVLLLGLRKKGFYSVTPVPEAAAVTGPIRYHLEAAHSYFSQDPKVALEAFSELVRGGREGLLITRTFPEVVRKDFGIQTTPIRWLAEERDQDAIPPGDLLGLSLAVKDFLQKAADPVVMLQGTEYLTTYNGFTPVLRLIQGLIEASATRRGILLLPVTPKSLDEKDEALLISETTPFPSPPTGTEGPRS